MKKNKEINLDRFLNPNENILTGREQGELSRKIIGLDSLDSDKNIEQIVFIVPENLIAITPSFYLGLLFKSFKKLELQNFQSRYKFNLLTQDNQLIKRLNQDLEEGIRASIDSLDKRSFLDKLLNK